MGNCVWRVGPEEIGSKSHCTLTNVGGDKVKGVWETVTDTEVEKGVTRRMDLALRSRVVR